MSRMQDAARDRFREVLRRAGLAAVPPKVALAALVLCALLVALGFWRWWPRAEVVTPPDDRAEVAPAAQPSPGGGATPSASEITVTVHVVGAVLHPGVYRLGGVSRVSDAVAAAGGLTGNAAESGVNLARKIEDGEQIAVPTLDELGEQTAATAAGHAPGSPGGAGGKSPSSGSQVNINTADAAALDALPGVGPSTAQKIIDDREANGPFESAEDLGRVAGIGPKKLEQLKDAICVR